MAKIHITDTAGDNPVPFLRGILTRSLTEAGLAFEDAYQVASDIRQQIGDSNTITQDDLRALVIQHLRAKHPSAVLDAYEAARTPLTGILVLNTAGELQPFSRNEHMRCLAACGLSEEQAGNASSMLMQELGDRQQWKITTDELRALSHECLKIHFGERAAERYRVWMDFTHSGRPLILLIGGGTGSGKSTIATELAHRLGIVRTQSTDMLREVMRMLIPERLLPVLHRSSFDAGSALPEKRGEAPDMAERVAEGYQRQLELLAVPCEAVIARAIRERVWLIVEGVHVHPALAERLTDIEDAVVVPIMLGVLRPEELRARLTGRRRDAPGRNTRVDPPNFQRIWQLQAYLLAEADRVGVPILINDDKDSVTTLVLRTVIDVLDAREPGA
jgi:2-phosphoglycerate kinase